MVKTQTVETVSAVVADKYKEDIHFTDEQVAVFGEFDDSSYSEDLDAFENALALLTEHDSVECVELDGLAIVPDRNTVAVEYCGGSKERSTTIEELQKAIRQARVQVGEQVN